MEESMNKQLLTAEQSIALEKVQQLFADWRNNRTGRSRIPDNLWQAAADLHHTQRMSINKIAHSLRLNHTALKEKIFDATHCTAVDSPEVGDESPLFIEITPAPEDTNCVIEMENQVGFKMRICFKGRADPAVISLGKYLLAGVP
jgi:hypothetical protein